MMKCASPSKIDRVTHDNFVSSLRTWCNTDTDLNPSVADLNVAWINQIAERLFVGAKVDLTKVVTLDGLSSVEVDFLKLAVPNLAYFAKSPHSTTTNESSLQLLKSWTGVPISLADSDNSVKSILINKLKFKNIILKLLTNASSDKRITRMQAFIANPTEMVLSSSTSSDEEDVAPSHSSNEYNAPQCPHTNRCEECNHCHDCGQCNDCSCCSHSKDCNDFKDHNHCKCFKDGNHCNDCHNGNDCKGCNHSSPNCSLQKSPQYNAVSPGQLSPQNACAPTPNNSELMNLCNRRRVPKLHIEYIEPTPGLLSSNYVNFKYNSPRYYHHNCFTSNVKDAKWAESLRGGYIPSHFRFNS